MTAWRDGLRHLFQQEMRALREEGAVLARDYPEAAGLLDPARTEDRDPLVERMLESFAFLSARVRQTVSIDDAALAEVLLELVEDGLDETLPSVAIVQARNRPGRPLPVRVAACEALRLGGPSPRGWRFELRRELVVSPLEIAQAAVEIDDRGRSHVEIELRRPDPERDPWPDPVVLYLHGDDPVVWSVRHGLCRRTESVEQMAGGAWIPVPDVGFRPFRTPGCSDDRHVHPLSEARDFLCVDERFRFVELHGLSGLGAGSALRLRAHLRGTFPRAVARAVSADVLRTHCAVAVNRYEESCQGLVWDHTRTEVPLHPPEGSEFLRAGEVRGERRAPDGSTIRTRFEPFSRHAHGSGDGPGNPVHRIRRARTSGGGIRTRLALGWPDSKSELAPESVVVQGWFCDGNRPHDDGAPREARPISPELSRDLEFQALARPTQAFRPPARIAPRTRFLTLAAVHFEGLLEARRLRDALRLFLWDPAESKRTLVDSIHEVVRTEESSLSEGVAAPLLRVVFRLRDTTCTPDTWERLGLLDAFGSVLARLAEEETPLGFRTRTTVVVEPCGVEFEY